MPLPRRKGEAAMAEIVHIRKALRTNPLKSSAPLGATLAYLGIAGAVPLLHGAQGCTSFALVLTVRHAREAIPLQTTALDEIATIMGGADNLEQALVNLTKRMKPRFIGVATTALVATRGEDIEGDLRLILARRPELAGVRVVLAQTPDYHGALEDGWAQAVSAIIDAIVEPADGAVPVPPRINLLPGVHQTAADIEWMVETAQAFSLVPVVLPDISLSLDGTVPAQYTPTTLGGTALEDIALMGRARHSIAIGEHMRAPAERLAARTGVPATVLRSLTGLGASAASWSMRCWTGISSSAAVASPSAPIPICSTPSRPFSPRWAPTSSPRSPPPPTRRIWRRFRRRRW